jgi:Ser-tRNA(Ala) deacylase AlaX
MQTKQVYYENQYKKELSANILSITTDNNMVKVILDQTIFYPMGGGQPSDQGVMVGEKGTIDVHEVLVKEGEIIHYGKLSGDLVVGDIVDCTIDWERRYKNMRVHSAGHVINDAVMQLFSDLTPIEADHGKKPFVQYSGKLDEISAGLIRERANKIVLENLDIITEFVSLDELKKRATWVPEHLPKNKPLRIMQIGKFSVIPDGGTQLKKTGEIGQITDIEIKNEGETISVYYKISSEDKKVERTYSDSSNNTSEFNSEDLINLKNQAIARIGMAHSASELEEIRIDLFGKNGSLTNSIKNIKNAPISGVFFETIFSLS